MGVYRPVDYFPVTIEEVDRLDSLQPARKSDNSSISSRWWMFNFSIRTCRRFLFLAGLLAIVPVFTYIIYYGHFTKHDFFEFSLTSKYFGSPMPGMNSDNNWTSLSVVPESTRESLSASVRIHGRKVVIGFRTGSSVVFDRLPVHLFNLEKQFGSAAFHQELDTDVKVHIYSDASVKLGQYQTIDAMDFVPDPVRNQTDFQTYFELHRMIEEGGDIKDFKDGWKLDKYKFFPMWSHLYKQYPEADWYIGVEDDLMIFWKGLFDFLSTQDPTKKLHFGCPYILFPRNALFANGGCGYVMSSALMKATYGSDPDFQGRFNNLIEHSCCGDGEFSNALLTSTSLDQLSESGNRFQREEPWAILFNKDLWCHPIVGLHHIDSFTAQKLYDFDEWARWKLPSEQTITYSHVFRGTAPPFLQKMMNSSLERDPIQHGWTVAKGDAGKDMSHPDIKTHEDCEKKCKQTETCLSWFWDGFVSGNGGRCRILENQFRIGQRVSNGDNKMKISGWMGERIRKLHYQSKTSCTASYKML